MQQAIRDISGQLEQCGYIADTDLAAAVVLMQQLERPLLIEGEAGVGKTAIAQALACALDTKMIRMQCFEGIDVSSALYEWNYSRQMLHIQFHATQGTTLAESSIYDETFLLERPLLSAIRQPAPPVLLIDEVDRADEAFEAFLLEVLSEFAVSIPELGTIEATSIPMVVLTSNGTRDLSDALRRRCLFHYAGYPGLKRELAIVSAKLPDLDRRLQAQAVKFVQAVREWDIVKRPGIAETLDWIQALNGFAVTDLVNCENVLESSLSCLFKTAEDRCFASRMMQQQRVADILSSHA